MTTTCVTSLVVGLQAHHETVALVHTVHLVPEDVLRGVEGEPGHVAEEVHHHDHQQRHHRVPSRAVNEGPRSLHNHGEAPLEIRALSKMVLDGRLKNHC